MRTAYYLAALAAAACVSVGCGGGSSLGSNSRARVTIASPDIEDLQLIVSPREGDPNDFEACSEDSAGFGCDLDVTSTTTTLRFNTDSRASSLPYYVYVRNLSGGTRTVSLDIYLDDRHPVAVDFDVFAGETLLVARVFRNSADDNFNNFKPARTITRR